MGQNPHGETADLQILHFAKITIDVFVTVRFCDP